MFSLSCRRLYFFFLMIRRPPRSTLDRSSAASDVYKRQLLVRLAGEVGLDVAEARALLQSDRYAAEVREREPVSYTHLRAHETVLDIVCRLLLEKKKTNNTTHTHTHTHTTTHRINKTLVYYNNSAILTRSQ